MFAFASITAYSIPLSIRFRWLFCRAFEYLHFFSSTFVLPNGSKIHARKHARPIKCTITVRWFAAPWGFARLPSSTYEAMNLLFDFLSARAVFRPNCTWIVPPSNVIMKSYRSYRSRWKHALNAEKRFFRCCCFLTRFCIPLPASNFSVQMHWGVPVYHLPVLFGFLSWFSRFVCLYVMSETRSFQCT